MSVRFYGACKGIVRQSCGAPYDYRKSLRSFLGQDDKLNLKPCVVLTITVHGRTGIVQCHCDVSTGYGLTIFSNLSLCGVKQNRRGHDAFLSSDDFFKINFSEKFFQEYHQSVKLFESRSCFLLIFFQNQLFKNNSFSNTISVPNSLVPEQARHFVIFLSKLFDKVFSRY